MHINPLSQKRLLSFLSLFVIINSGCVTIPDSTPCHVPNKLSLGGLCAHTNTQSNVTIQLTFAEMIDLLEPQTARTCVPVDAMLNVCKEDQSAGIAIQLPARSGSVIIESDQYESMKTKMEVMCRMLGNRCSYNLAH